MAASGTLLTLFRLDLSAELAYCREVRGRRDETLEQVGDGLTIFAVRA